MHPALLMLFMVPALFAEGAPPPDLEALPDEIPEEALALPEDLPDDEAEQVALGTTPPLQTEPGTTRPVPVKTEEVTPGTTPPPGPA
jgi:hypothetical protein